MPVQVASAMEVSGVAAALGLGDGDGMVEVGDGSTAVEAVGNEAGVAVDVGVGDPVADGEQPASRSATRMPRIGWRRGVMGDLLTIIASRV